jgi:hypothetical protein
LCPRFFKSDAIFLTGTVHLNCIRNFVKLQIIGVKICHDDEKVYKAFEPKPFSFEDYFICTVENYCPECFGQPTEAGGIYYCSQCGLVLGVVLYYGKMPLDRIVWNSKISRSVSIVTKQAPKILERRATYIANKLVKEYHAPPGTAAVAGLLAASRELGIKVETRAAKTTKRKAKALLTKAQKEGVITINEKTEDPFLEQLRMYSTQFGIPFKAVLEIYNRNKSILMNRRPSVVVRAIGVYLGVSVPFGKTKTVTRLVKMIAASEAARKIGAVVHKSAKGGEVNVPEEVWEISEG